MPKWNPPTPYERCENAGHKRARHSPDGETVLEECSICRLQWVMPSRWSFLYRPKTIYNPSVFKRRRSNND